MGEEAGRDRRRTVAFPRPEHLTLETLRKRLQWAEQNGQPKIAADYRVRPTRAEQIAPHLPTDQAEVEAWSKALDRVYPYPEDMDERIQHSKDLGLDLKAIDLPALLDDMVGEGRVWTERFRRSKGAKVAGDKTVTVQVEKYLALDKARVQGNATSVGEYEIVSRALHDFQDWIGGTASVESIDADKVEDYWSHLVGAKLSIETKKKKLRHLKNFIGWLAEKGKIPRPLNLDSRKHRFGSGLKAIKTVDTKEVKRLIEVASGQLKLYILLMSNCGYTQIDISDLKPSEVDWQKGRIKRKRSKTDHQEDVPVVDYPLWPETFALLQKYGHREGDHALLTESGKCWVRDYLKPDGKRSKVDNIKSNFAHIKKREKLGYSPKHLRKTSSTLLGKDHPDSLVTLFLGQSPWTIATRHYQAPDQGRFDGAVMKLRAVYGFSQ